MSAPSRFLLRDSVMGGNAPRTMSQAMADRWRRWQREYYAHMLKGVHGNVTEVAREMQGWGCVVGYVGHFMRWDDQAYDLMVARGITIDDARRELIEQLSAPAIPQPFPQAAE